VAVHLREVQEAQVQGELAQVQEQLLALEMLVYLMAQVVVVQAQHPAELVKLVHWLLNMQALSQQQHQLRVLQR
jgi:hypothetical protein